jgi:hypothetical protein
MSLRLKPASVLELSAVACRKARLVDRRGDTSYLLYWVRSGPRRPRPVVFLPELGSGVR